MSVHEINNMKLTYLQTEGDISTINIMFRTGSINETENIIGMSHLLEHLILCDKRIDKMIDRGAVFNGTTEPQLTCYYFTSLNEVFLNLADMFLDIMTFKNVDFSVLEKEKEVVVQEIKNCHVDPDCQMYVRMKRDIFKNSLGHETVGLEEDIMRITKKEINSYFKKYYNKSTMVINIVSSIPLDDIKMLLKNSTINKMPVGKYYSMDKKLKTQKSMRLIELPNKIEKSFFTFGIIIDKKDYYTCSLLLKILAGNLNARLYKKLRNKGYIYSIKNEIGLYNNNGLVILSTSCDKSKLKICIDVIIKEFESIGTNIKKSEYKNSIISKKATILISMQSTENLCDFIGRQYSIGNSLDLKEYVQKFESVTFEEMKRVANKYFKRSRMNIISNDINEL